MQTGVVAASACGLAEDDGERAALATIKSAFQVGLSKPRAVPDRHFDLNGGRRREIAAGPKQTNDPVIGKCLAPAQRHELDTTNHLMQTEADPYGFR
jgi:hypothetical protein